MNIHELDSYDLGDAVKFNDRLNPRIWGADEKMRPEVREQLLRIADDFREFLGIDVEVKDITVSGSNAAYTYTPHSDIDLHLVVDLPEADANEVYRELFDAKKYAYNDMHNIKIGGYDVELYVQDARKTHHSQGIYSVMNDDWVSVPKRRRPDVDDISVKSKFEDLGHRIEEAIRSADYEKISSLTDKLKDYRQAGLNVHGEFGPENLAFKILRTQGLIKKLYDARNEAKDRMLSLDERKKKRKKKVRYGYGGYWYPGTAYAGQDHPAGSEGGDGGGGGESIREDAGMTWDGVNPTTDMFTSEDATMTWDGVNPSTAMFTTETEDKTDEEILRDFIDFCVKELKIEQIPRIKLRRDPQWPAVHKTFGRYNDEAKTLEVAWGQRHIMDVLRTVAHELTHKHQHEREGERMGPDAGETGSPYENEANARAGVLMRDYGRLHPEYFSVGQATDLNEEEKVYGIAGFKVIVKDGYFYIYKGPDLIYRSVAPRTYTRDQLIKQVERAITMTGATVKQSGTRAKPKYGIEDAYKRLLQIITYRVDRGIDIDPETIRKEIATIVNDYEVTEKDLRKKWAQTKPYKYSKTPELFAPYSRFYKYFSSNSNTPWSELYQVRRDDKYYQWLDTQMKNWMQKHGLTVTESASGYIPTRAQAKDPRYSMALTQDIRPGQVGKEANKLKLKTDRQGHPQIARANGLFESLMAEFQQFKEFAPSPDSGDDGQGSDYLTQLANRWWNAADTRDQQRIADVIRTFGYEITQVESEDDAVQLTDIKGKADPIFISADEFDPDLFETEQNFAIASQPIPGDKFKLTINNRPFVLTPGGFGKQHSQYFLDSFYLTDMKSGKTEFVDSGWNWPLAQAIYAHLDQNHADALVRIGKADFAWHEKNNDWDSQPPRLQGIRRQTSVGIPAKDFVKSVDTVKRDTGQDLNEDEDLDEVKMSPGALEKFATSDAAKGIRAGFEAELIFRDTQGESEELDPEPNYDADERAYSIQQVIDFFSNDEYGFGLSDRQQNRLMDDLDEKYMEWRDEQIISDFRNDAEDLIREILLAETPMDQRIHFYLTDSLQMSDEEADAVIKAGAEAPRFTNSTAQKDYADENPEYKAYLEAADEAEQELEESVEFSVNRQDEYWDEALDKYRDDYSGDDDSFFSDVGLRWMSDIANEFNLDWPVWDGGEQQNYGNRNWEDIGASLQDAVDMPVVVSSSYHSTRRRPGQWIIEPDGSLDPDDKSEEAGLEIVSPPMPLLTAIEKLKAVTDWANDPNGGNAYTNSSTGLHMGVSLPTMKSEDVPDDIGIDYVKLILFLGDKYVQQQFGREANTYCASALDKLKQNIKGKKSDPARVVELLRHGLTELAQRELQKGVGTSKYTSAHIQPGYIEFRSPGGDWLAKADEEIGVLENTMLRFARAMAIAGDPNAERQEYAKKLYKLVTTDNEQYADQLRLFSEFSAGTINKEQLKKQWADAVLQKELPDTGKKEYEVYDADNAESPDGILDTFYANNDEDAYNQYEKKYISTAKWTSSNIRIKQPWFDVFDDAGRIVKTIRAKDIDKATDRAQYEFGERWTDGWRVYRRPDDTPEPKASPRAQVAKRIVTKPRTPTEYNYDIIDQRTLDLKAIDRFYAANDEEASRVFDQWLKMKNLPNDTANYGYRRSAQNRDARKDSADLQRTLGVTDIETDVAQNFEPSRENYELYQQDDPSRIIHRMPYATAEEVRAWIAQQEREGMPPGFLRARIPESIDPVSGAGAVPPRNYPKSIGKKTVEPVEKAFKQPVKSGLYKSAIGQAISQRDLENMTNQIQVARKLGDSVMEMEDTPPEVMRALDQAAQKNGYRNWADVKSNPRSDRAVITVARLANEIMKTTGPQHEKIFYKSKTDENFADKKVKGKSRPGRVKRAGASCSGSVTDLRARAKKYGGEKGKMYHWCANMKAGRKK